MKRFITKLISIFGAYPNNCVHPSDYKYQFELNCLKFPAIVLKHLGSLVTRKLMLLLP